MALRASSSTEMGDAWQAYSSLHHEVEEYINLLNHHCRFLHDKACFDILAKQREFESVNFPGVPTFQCLAELRTALESRYHEQLREMCNEIEEREIRITSLLYALSDQMQS